MPRDLSVLGEHTFDTKNREALTREIAVRFQTNVYFAFYDSYQLVNDMLPSLAKLGVENYDTNFDDKKMYMVHSYTNFSKKKSPIVILEDEYYYKWYLEKYGPKAFHRKEFIKNWGNPTEQALKYVYDKIESYPILDLHGATMVCSLYKHAIEVNPAYYFTDFNNFFRLVLRLESVHSGYFQTKSYFESLLKFRKDNTEIIKKIGGDCLYYYDSSNRNPNYAMQVDVYEATWTEIQDTLNSTRAKAQTVDLCKLLTQKDYLAEHQAKDGINSFSCFYDDLRPLNYEDILPWIEDNSYGSIF